MAQRKKEDTLQQPICILRIISYELPFVSCIIHLFHVSCVAEKLFTSAYQEREEVVKANQQLPLKGYFL